MEEAVRQVLELSSARLANMRSEKGFAGRYLCRADWWACLTGR